jgi:hypothetical protein
MYLNHIKNRFSTITVSIIFPMMAVRIIANF